MNTPSLPTFQRKLGEMSAWFGSKRHALLCAVVLSMTHVSAPGQSHPLPPWSLYGGGINSTWDGASTSPDNAQLTATLFGPPAMPNQYVTATAISSQEVLRIAPATTYIFTFSAMKSGGTAACVGQMEMEDGSSVINSAIVSSITWQRYTNSFSTGGPDDVRVGRPLNLRLAVMKSGSQFGTTTAAFTNIQLQVSSTLPVLTLLKSGVDTMKLQWPTNYYWYVPEQTTDLQTGVWEQLTNLPDIEGDHYSVELNRDEAQRFFRLRY